MNTYSIKRLKDRVLECGGTVFFGDIVLGGEDYLGNSEKPIVTANPFSETESIRIRAVKVDETGNLHIIGEDEDGEIIDPLDVNDILLDGVDEIADAIIMEEHTIWMRLGVTVKGTRKEIDTILSGEGDAGEVLCKLLQRHQYEIDGETIIPSCCVEEYNNENGTNFDVRDLEF